jgi:hypothetical protein
MRFADRDFEELVWSRPTHSSPDWVELGALLTPLGDAGALLREAIPLASAAATRRFLVVGYAHRLPVRVVSSEGDGRRKVVQRHARFEGHRRRDIRLRLRTAVNRLACGADWLGDMPDATPAALALWRATLLNNGLVGAVGSPFSLRIGAAERAAALCAAAESLQLRPQLVRGRDGLRLTLDPAAGERLITHLVMPSAPRP